MCVERGQGRRGIVPFGLINREGGREGGSNERDVALVLPHLRKARSIALELLVSSSMIYIWEKHLEDAKKI